MALHGTDRSEKPTTLIGNDDTHYLLLAPEPLPPDAQGPTALLGKGAFGTVSIALTEDLTPLAVKKIVLDKTAPTYAKTIAEIDKETRIMRHLKRQADLIVHNTDDSNQVEIFVIQPFIVGIELEKFLQQLNAKSAALENTDIVGKLNILKEAITSWIATMEATMQLHDANIIHGDLHANNVLYDPLTKQATLIDFGMSHQLEPGQEKIYTATEEELIGGFHRAPETRTFKARREGHPPERVYDKSSDVYSLAIDFGVAPDFSENYAPDEAGKEVAQILKLCKDLSQEKMLGGNNDSSQRVSLADGIARLKAIQSQIDVRIWQQIYVLPRIEIQQLAEQKRAAHSLQQQILEQKLPPNIKQEIKEFSRLIKQRWADIHPSTALQPNAPSSTQRRSPLERPMPVLLLGKRRRTLDKSSPPGNSPNVASVSTDTPVMPPPKKK